MLETKYHELITEGEFAGCYYPNLSSINLTPARAKAVFEEAEALKLKGEKVAYIDPKANPFGIDTIELTRRLVEKHARTDDLEIVNYLHKNKSN